MDAEPAAASFARRRLRWICTHAKPGRRGPATRHAPSIFFVSGLVGLDEFPLDLRRYRFVVAEIQRIPAPAGRHRLQLRRIAFQFGQRDLRLHHDLAAAHRVGAVDPGALGRQAAADVAHVRLGDGDLEVDDGFEHLRTGLEDGVEEGLLAGGDERDLLAVDRMVLAIVDDHPDVLHGVAGDRAGGQHLAHAFLDRRHELAGDGAALHFVDELEAAAARQRLDAQKHLTELTGAARLLLVTVVAFRGRRDRLFVRYAWRPGLDLDLVLRHAGAERQWRL